MRVIAISDLHVDYDQNARWVRQLSTWDYRDDVLLLAGDVSDRLDRLDECLRIVAARFRQVLFVPGNHELWVIRDPDIEDSLAKFTRVMTVAADNGVSARPYHRDGLSVFPIFGWYDYSFGTPEEALARVWMDFHACRWPQGMKAPDVSAHFNALNHDAGPPMQARHVISFSHFLPRPDVLPAYLPAAARKLDPVLGTHRIERQLRALGASIHVFGHSHINTRTVIDGVTYLNNAFGYPGEAWSHAKRLECVWEA